MLLARRVEIWSTRQSAGGTRLAVIPDDIAVEELRSVAGEESLTLALPLLSDAAASLLERRVLRCDFDDSTFDEWRISQITERRTDQGELLLDVTAVPMLYDLAEDCVVSRAEADGSVVMDFEALQLTPTQIINSFILPALTAEGITDIALGTIDFTLPVDLVFQWDTPLGALRRLAQITGGELQLRRNGTTDYKIDLLTQIGSGATALDLRFGKNLPWLTRERSTADLATRCQPRGQQEEFLYASMAGARWKVTNVSGSDITLADPSGGDGPIAFNDQLNGCYLRKVGGTLTQITATVASTQKVTVASAASISVNDLIEIRKDSAGAVLTYLENPAAKTTYGRRVQILDRPDLPSTINLIGNPAMRDYAGASSAPDTWGSVGSPTLTRTSTAGRWQTGGFSCRIQGAADGDGVETGYAAFSPTSSLPYFSGFVSFWLDAGRVRCELIAAKDAGSVTGITRTGTTATATTSAAHGLTAGKQVEVLGAAQSAYNGIVVVTSVPTGTTFTYEVVGAPTTPATGTITWAQVWRIPNGTEGALLSDQTKVWVQQGMTGQDLNALGATRAKLRLLQDGGTAIDAYLDAAQLTQTSSHRAFVEGAGPNRLWQAANDLLLLRAAPALRYEAAWIDLKQLDSLTWGYEDVTLGGPVNIRDEAIGITATTRVLGWRRSVRVGEVVDLILSSAGTDYTDQQLRPRLPPRHIPDATVNTALEASAYFTPILASPGTIQVRLGANIPGPTLYYWLGDVGEAPPPRTTVQAGAPSSAAWGTYSAAFTVSQDQSTDLQLHVYALRGSQRSQVRTYVIDHDTTPSATLMLSEPVASKVRAAWTPDDDTVEVILYLGDDVGGAGYPTSDHSATGTLDQSMFWARLPVDPDFAGFDIAGAPLAGGTAIEKSGLGTSVLGVILIPIDRQGNAGSRVTATITLAGAGSPALVAPMSVSRTNDGSACDTTNGAEYTFTWTVNPAVTDGTHDVEVVASVLGAEYTATEVSPVTNTSKTVRIPFYKTADKFDPFLTVTLLIRLKAGATVLQEETLDTDSLKSSCAL